MTSFNERMRELRTEKGLNKVDVANGTGLSRSAITMYENGKRDNPTLPIVKRIAIFFDVSIDYVAGISDIKDRDVSSKTLTDIFVKLNDSYKIQLVTYAKYLIKEQDDGKHV